MIELVKLMAVFALIVLILKYTKLLSLTIGCAALAVIPLFHLDWLASLKTSGKSVISPLTITTTCAFYIITFLQRMLEKRGKLTRAQEALYGIFNNRRINASLSPMMIGMLSAAGVVAIAGSIVGKSAGDSLDAEEKTFISSYYRHVPESFMPTFPGAIIGAELAGIALSSFLAGMISVVILIISLGFIFYLRKVPKHTGSPPEADKARKIIVFSKVSGPCLSS